MLVSEAHLLCRTDRNPFRRLRSSSLSYQQLSIFYLHSIIPHVRSPHQHHLTQRRACRAWQERTDWLHASRLELCPFLTSQHLSFEKGFDGSEFNRTQPATRLNAQLFLCIYDHSTFENLSLDFTHQCSEAHSSRKNIKHELRKKIKKPKKTKGLGTVKSRCLAKLPPPSLSLPPLAFFFFLLLCSITFGGDLTATSDCQV